MGLRRHKHVNDSFAGKVCHEILSELNDHFDSIDESESIHESG